MADRLFIFMALLRQGYEGHATLLLSIFNKFFISILWKDGRAMRSFTRSMVEDMRCTSNF